MAVDVRDLGEFGLIERLAKSLGVPTDERLVVGIGDDAAVWRTDRRYIIATTDTMVEGVHFLPGRVAWRDVGWKAMASNVSDIAAMGGTPTFALATLALPPTTPVEHADALYAGLRECADAYGVTVAGGDIVSAPQVSITVALMGQALTGTGGQPLLLRRSAAKVGDLIAVSGPLGAPAGGLRALRDGEGSRYPTLVESHMRPQPRVDAGKAAVMAGLHCGIDISDGLAQDIGHICERSAVRAEIDAAAVPVDDNLRLAYPDDAATMALTGGEDYELVLVGAELSLKECAGMLREATLGAQLHIIGRITMGAPGVHVLDDAGREIDVGSGGFDHLGGSAS